MVVFGSFLLCGLDTKKAEHRLAVSWCSDLHHSEPHNSILCGQLRLGEPHCGQRRRSKPHCGQLRRSELDPSELRHPAPQPLKSIAVPLPQIYGLIGPPKSA